MPEYNVTVTVSTTTRTITVEADDLEEAREDALERVTGELTNGFDEEAVVSTEPHVAGVEMTAASVEKLYEEILGRLKGKYTLFSPEYDDSLSTEQIAKIAQGDITGVEEEMWEFLADHRDYNTGYIINDVTTEDERLALGDRLEELRFAIEERDDSDPLHQLARRTSDASFRYRLTEDFYVYSDEEGATKTIAGILGVSESDAGVSWIVSQGGSSGALFLYFSLDVEELLRVMEGISFRDEVFTLTASGTDVMILSTMNGSGMVTDDPIDFTWTGDFDPTDLFLDARNAGGGYSWDETTGGSSPSGSGTVTFTKKEEDNA